MAKKTTNKIKIKLTRSLIGATKKQIKIAAALGLKKTNQVVEHDQTPVITGMVKAIPHLVEITE